MKHMPAYLVILLSLAILTGCTSRDQADLYLARGCEAGVKSLMEDGYEILEIKNKTFSETSINTSYRKVTLSVVETDHWLEEEKEYTCIFNESFGFLGMKYSASIYQLDTGQKIIGLVNGKITGSTEDFTKLTEAIAGAMY